MNIKGIEQKLLGHINLQPKALNFEIIHSSAGDDWTAEVYVVQDKDGNVKAVDVKNANVGNSSLGKSFMDSIERAVYQASPFPAAPDDAVFDSEIYLFFSVN